MAELIVHKEPTAAGRHRFDTSDSISCMMSLIDHEGREFSVEVGIYQESDQLPVFHFNVSRTDTSQSETSREPIYTREVNLPFEGVVTHEMAEFS